MSANPILVLQMQRMGDLVLSFPLLALLQCRFPEHPVWTVAEPRFFSELYGLAPNTVFFPPDAEDRLRTVEFHSVINLSHREDAARIAGSLTAQTRSGAYLRDAHTYISGYWSLYRASIVHNNRHNLYHWSDLQLLDHLQGRPLTPLSSVNIHRHPSGRVGIFVGASEAEKRPDPEFFGQLGKALLRKGWKPLFLGGKEDAALGEAAMRISGIPGSSMCGRLDLSQLAELMTGLALCITPDTGPMHLATWVNTPVLNLSLGPVNAWETGPVMPGQHVLRPALSCAGCWQCAGSSSRCRQKFHPGRVAMVAHTLLHAPEQLGNLHLPGLKLLRTARDARGLFTLEPVAEQDNAAFSARHALSRFWQDWFWGCQGGERIFPAAALTALVEAHPAALSILQKALLHLGREVRSHIRQWRHGGPKALPHAFWHALPPAIRPFSGHMHLYLQNEEYAHAAWQSVLEDMDVLANNLNIRT